MTFIAQGDGEEGRVTVSSGPEGPYVWNGAQVPGLEPGLVVASKGQYVDYVLLELESAGLNIFYYDVEVQGHSEGGAGLVATEEGVFRGPTEFTVTWERRGWDQEESDVPEWTAEAETGRVEFEDDDAPGGFWERRYYRAVVEAPGADPSSATAVADWGYRGMNCDPELDDVWSGGEGTVSDPFRICSREQLEEIVMDSPQHYALVADLNLEDDGPFLPLGVVEAAGSNTVAFEGTFDGNFFRISGLSIIRDFPNNGSYPRGLFAELGEEGVIRNVILDSVDVEGLFAGTGALVGISFGTIENCSSSGQVKANQFAGGLVGLLRGTLRQSRSSTDVSFDTNNSTFPPVGIGGLVGQCEMAGSDPLPFVGVSDSYAIGSVEGWWAGGLLGEQRTVCIVRRSYSAGHVVEPDSVLLMDFSSLEPPLDVEVGGLVGSVEGDVSNSYWDTETSGRVPRDNGEAGQGIETGQFSGPFDSWAFEPDAATPRWRIADVDGIPRPRLIWEFDGEDLRSGIAP